MGPTARSPAAGARIRAAFAELTAGTPVAVAVLPVEDRPAEHADELAVVAGASAKRRAEFLSGRRCARAALAAAGLPHDGPLLPLRRHGPPRWPAGVVGSIAHGGGWCVALAAAAPPGGAVAGLGVDLEPVAPLGAPVRHRILGGDDPSGWPVPGGVDPALVAFVVKEAVFKCTHPLDGTWRDFDELHLDLGPGRW